MEREILFRGKRKSNGKWIEGYIYKQIVNLNDEYYIRRGDTDYLVVPETVGQFTGLTDNNGNKIFEGDIVLSSSNSEQAVVKWDDYSACFLLSFNGWCADFDIPYELEVIGNIHDNPELLKDDDILSEKRKEFYEKKKAITERLRKDNEAFK